MDCRNMAGWLAALRVTVATVAAVAVAGSCAATGGPTVHRGRKVQNNSSEILAQSLRRQLMKDNYDYISTESEEPQYRLLAKQNHSSEDVIEAKVIMATVLDGDKRKKHPGHKISSQGKKKNKIRRNLFQKLVKRRMKIQKHMYGTDETVDKRYSSRHRNNILDDDNIEQISTVKYKILKLRRPYRRSGHAAVLIQEESPQGVSLVKLGGGPFPELRLPGARRQYMAGPGPLRDPEYEELPPPPVGDLPAADEAPAQSDPVTQNTIRLPESYVNNEKVSLKITVTPDEIFVL